MQENNDSSNPLEEDSFAGWGVHQVINDLGDEPVAKNYMFIGTPGDRFPHNIAELGGVRLII